MSGPFFEIYESPTVGFMIKGKQSYSQFSANIARFTSIGGVNNTKPNPGLKNDRKFCGFDAAYKLRDGSKERLGRF